MKTLIINFGIIDSSRNDTLILIAIIIIGLILMVFLIDRFFYNKKIKRIISAHKGKKKKGILIDKEKLPSTKGWGMNDSPFRERKSGLTWGGGNIKGANAKRGTRRSFLK